MAEMNFISNLNSGNCVDTPQVCMCVCVFECVKKASVC